MLRRSLCAAPLIRSAEHNLCRPLLWDVMALDSSRVQYSTSPGTGTPYPNTYQQRSQMVVPSNSDGGHASMSLPSPYVASNRSGHFYGRGSVAGATDGVNNTVPGGGVGRNYMHRASRTPLDRSSFVEQVPRNKIINIVPQGREYVVERLGTFHRTLGSGWWFVAPFIDRIRYAYTVKEQGIELFNQSAITSDNVMVEVDGVIFLRIVDVRKASYNIENPVYNLLNLAQTTMRSEIGKLDLDTLFRERAVLNKNIVEILKGEAADWGIECKRVEIRDITVSELVRQSMDLQADAERRKRQLILQSEGEAQAEVNRAEGMKKAQLCAADANKYSVVKQAEGEAEATKRKAQAVAESVTTVAAAFDRAPNSKSCSDAVALRVAEQYIEKFGEIARQTNTVVLSGQNMSDPATFAAQALALYNTLSSKTGGCSTTPLDPNPVGTNDSKQ
ncbi:hypothetical protein TRVL_04856 [Trypanosoma vivax]|uniref:Band 7 domain-containing protein n=1 Tax=Trypanosoma vivax (strain Y486) TaxID=1055687 RepID=G0TV38_TRYVY|nr:hypothetical protein TRVL_04856 [Trypanosoma vivax]CCC47803.1 conserved hypothetical protein [Trypanosoma vivax Y486]